MQPPRYLGQRRKQQVVLVPFYTRADAAADQQKLQALGGYTDARVIDSQ
jgi:hypothetical protein